MSLVEPLGRTVERSRQKPDERRCHRAIACVAGERPAIMWHAFQDLQEHRPDVSEVGFGLWTISTGWWGNFTEGEAIN